MSKMNPAEVPPLLGRVVRPLLRKTAITVAVVALTFALIVFDTRAESSVVGAPINALAACDAVHAFLDPVWNIRPPSECRGSG